jgi:hypothetical protein
VSGRFISVCSALLLFTSVAFGGGDYQRTKDGKTTVWNAEPKPGDEATWFGDRDGEGYATGAGTITWYTAKGNVYGRYFGNMVRGKFNGSVNVHSNGKTGHAIFADGKRTTRWAAGPAPSRSEPDRQLTAKAAEPPTGEVTTNSQRRITRALPVEPAPEKPLAKTEKSAPRTEPAAPAAGPPAAPRTGGAVAKAESAEPPTEANAARTEETPDQTAEGSLLRAKPATAAVREQKSEQASVAKATSSVDEEVSRLHQGYGEPGKSETVDRPPDSGVEKSPPRADSDNSLRLLAGPPSSLHTKPVSEGPPATANPETAPSSYTNARLTKDKVVDLADAEARSRGYDLSDYQRMDPQYYPADEIWSLGYNGTTEIGKHFSVTIDDKTKGTVFVPGK